MMHDRRGRRAPEAEGLESRDSRENSWKGLATSMIDDDGYAHTRNDF